MTSNFFLTYFYLFSLCLSLTKKVTITTHITKESNYFLFLENEKNDAFLKFHLLTFFVTETPGGSISYKHQTFFFHSLWSLGHLNFVGIDSLPDIFAVATEKETKSYSLEIKSRLVVYLLNGESLLFWISLSTKILKNNKTIY